MKLNIIRFISDGFNAQQISFGLTGGDIYVTTFVPKPIKYQISRIPHSFLVLFMMMLVRENVDYNLKANIYDFFPRKEEVFDCENMSDGYLYRFCFMWEYIF